MKKNYKLYEAIADIALNVGHLIGDDDEYDSRRLVSEIVKWAREFEKQHKDTDWEEEDYMLTVESFSEEKWDSFIGNDKVIGYQLVDEDDDMPDELFSFQVFRREQDALDFMKEKGLEGYSPVAVRKGDVEGPQFIGKAVKDLFGSVKTEQDIFDVFASLFSRKVTSYEPEETYEDRVHAEACAAFVESCGTIESRCPWLKENDSDGEAWYDSYHDEVVSLYCSMLKDEVRRCNHCGKPMKEGYYLAGEYACSEECCLALYNGNRAQMEDDLSYADEDGECYWTEWESIYFDD